ncbi:MAG: GNAT family N-acetyltransferase [Oscillochloris sp.]|nr:GNAT family N-acetyltransferase [Oscillochloris sp.]
MPTIERLDAHAATAIRDALCAILRDAVENGASVGFLPPLTSTDAAQYWDEVIVEISTGARALLIARIGGMAVASIQLVLPNRPNASHRAEVQKLIVHHAARRHGIGTALMAAVENLAREFGRSLLVLDTRAGDDAERLYRKLGYHEAGRIPGYARSADGVLHTTVFFYRELGHTES